MGCSCIKDIFNFHILTTNCCSELYFQDASVWMDSTYGSDYAKPDTFEINIVGPTSSVTQEVSTSGLTKLELGCIDGLYCFKFVNCDGAELSRNYLHTYKLDNKIECLYLNRDDLRVELDLIKHIVSAAKIATERGMQERAYDYLEHAREKLSYYDCNCGCK